MNDDFDGIYPYALLAHRLREEFARSRRMDRTLSVLMLRLDGFENFDVPVAEPMHRALRELLVKTVRIEDVAFDGVTDEFYVILPETTLAGAREAADRIRSKLNAAQIPAGPDRHATASIGIVAVNLREFERSIEPADLLEYAADTLAKARSFGGNHIMAYS